MLLAFISTLSALAFSMTLELHRLPKHNIHSDRYMRRLSTEDGMMELVPLHLGFGTHYTWVYAGTPPQRASVIVDTGSAFMAFPCSDCDGCGNHTDQPFAAKNSSTLVYVPCAELSSFRCKDCGVTSNTCTVSQTYQEGSSWKATVVEDVVYLGGDSSFEDMTMRDQYGTYFQFGCQKSETGLFLTQVADGIMGLSNTGKHIVAKLHRENKILSNLFSLCFLENGGTMSIGQPHLSAHRGEISYAKVLSDRSAGEFYDVHVKDVRIGGKSINASEEAFIRGHFIVDSGTTDSYLPRLLQTEFMAMFKEVSGRDYRVGDSCRGYTNDDLASLPSIQLVMEAHGDGNGEVVLNIPPEQYLTKMNGAFCSSLYLTENSGGVIGANLMMNRDVIFDISNQRVGFVDADCAYQGDRNSTADLSASNKTTNISEGKEKGTVTIVGVPSATSTVDTPAPIVGAVPTVPTSVATDISAPIAGAVPTAPTSVAIDISAPIAGAVPTAPTSVATDISAPIAGAVPTAPTSVATDISSPTAGAVPTATTPAAIISKPVATAESTSALVPVATEPTTTAGATPLTAVVTNSSALNNVSSIADSQIEPLSGQTTMVPTSSSSAAMGDSKSKEKLSGTHPVVLSVVGTILVVGFLVMLLISVSRRRQKAAKDQLWSRVKSDEENEEDDDEEEFGLVHHHDKKQPSIKHERLDREEDEEDHASSSSKEEEDDEVFDLKPIQEESTVVDNGILERL
ncbi:unnamed protein product [Peronospora belbahrii]|uniref:Peptidase A1 domain-containing protein n=1 Tax=Peronospora belbahrii TaxID=622444 RepID=A0ABN8DF84_9STRA|nr:unnamed protein product [Peronospora belbahrii]